MKACNYGQEIYLKFIKSTKRRQKTNLDHALTDKISREPSTICKTQNSINTYILEII